MLRIYQMMVAVIIVAIEEVVAIRMQVVVRMKVEEVIAFEPGEVA